MALRSALSNHLWSIMKSYIMNATRAKHLFILIALTNFFLLPVICQAQLAKHSSILVNSDKYVFNSMGELYYIEFRSDSTFQVGGGTSTKDGTYVNNLIDVELSTKVPSSGMFPPVPVVAVRKLLILGDILVSPDTGTFYVKVN